MGLREFAKQLFSPLSGQETRYGGRLDDLEVLAADLAFAADHTVDYYWFEVVEHAGARDWHGFRVIKLSELTYIPQEARETNALIRKQAALQRGLWAAGVELITLSFGIFNPPVGIVQCYGVGTRAEEKDIAVDLAQAGHASLLANFAAQFPQSRLRPLVIDRAKFLYEARSAMRCVTALIGQPDPREGARGGAQARGLARGPELYSEQQNEILFRAMARAQEEFLFLNIATPVARRDLARMQAALGNLASPIASRQQGATSIGFGVSLPVMLSVAQGQSAGQAYGTSESRGEADSVGVARGLAHTDGTANTSSWAHSVGTAHTEGLAQTESVTHTTGTSHSVSVSDGTAHTVGSAQTHGVTQTSGTAETNGSSTTHGVTDSSSSAVSGGVADSQSASLGWNVGGNVGGTLQPEVAATQIGSLRGGLSGGLSGANSWGQTVNSGWANTSGQAVSDSTTTSHATTVSHSTSISDAVTHSQADTTSHSQGVSNSVMESTSYGQATTRSQADSVSEGWTTGGAFTRSQADSVSQSVSAAHGVTRGQGVSLGQTLGAMQSAGLSGGVAPSVSVGKSFQWKDENAIAITQLLEEQLHILAEAVEEGGFYTDTYILTRNEHGRRTAEAAAVQAFGGSQGVVTHVQPRRPQDGAEAAHLRQHARAFMPSTLTETLGWLNGYAFATLVTPTQQAAYSAPGLFEEGTTLTMQERTPPFAFRPDMPGNTVLGHLYSTERGEQTNAPLRLTEDRHFHTIFAADTGFGKTIAAERLAVEVVGGWHHRAVVLDFGAGWRKLLNAPLPPERLDLYQLYPGASRPFRWNFMQIGRRIPPDEQVPAMAELFCAAGRMGPRQFAFIRDALRQVYMKAGVLLLSPTDRPEKDSFDPAWQVVQRDEVDIALRAQAERHLKPHPIEPKDSLFKLHRYEKQAILVHRSRGITVADLCSRLRKFAGKMGPQDPSRAALEGALLRLEPFTRGELARMYGGGDSSDGVAPVAVEDLGLLGPESNPADRWGLCILEGGSEMDKYAKTVILSMVAWHLYSDSVIRRRETIGGFNRPLDIFWEEANKILSGVGESDTSTSSTSGAVELWQTMWRDGRKYRVFLHPLVQNLSELPPGILSSCNNAFFGQMKKPEDRDLAVSHLARSERGFTDEEYKRYMSRIPRELAIVKFGYSADVTDLEPLLARPLMVRCPEPDDAAIHRHFEKE
jgi:hypothetical protein